MEWEPITWIQNQLKVVWYEKAPAVGVYHFNFSCLPLVSSSLPLKCVLQPPLIDIQIRIESRSYHTPESLALRSKIVDPIFLHHFWLGYPPRRRIFQLNICP